jgi:hypothetical protein
MTWVPNHITGIVNSLLTAKPSSLDLWALETLARAYSLPSTPAYNNSLALGQIIGGLDAIYTAYLADSGVMSSSAQQWQGFGRVGMIMALLAGQLDTQLSQDVSGLTGTTRRTAYTKMLVDSRDHWRQNFPQYTNQAVICAMGIYQANRGLSVIAPNQALTEPKARTYLYQSVGISPWLGSEDANGNPRKPYGDTFYLVTKKLRP